MLINICSSSRALNPLSSLSWAPPLYFKSGLKCTSSRSTGDFNRKSLWTFFKGYLDIWPRITQRKAHFILHKPLLGFCWDNEHFSWMKQTAYNYVLCSNIYHILNDMADLGIHKIFIKNDFSYIDMGFLFIFIEIFKMKYESSCPYKYYP